MILADIVRSKWRDVNGVRRRSTKGARDDDRRGKGTRPKFKHNEGFVFSGKDGVLEMTAKDADGVVRILHRVGSKNPGFVQKSRADGNAREDNFGSDLQLPRDVLVVLH